MVSVHVTATKQHLKTKLESSKKTLVMKVQKKFSSLRKEV